MTQAILALKLLTTLSTSQCVVECLLGDHLVKRVTATVSIYIYSAIYSMCVHVCTSCLYSRYFLFDSYVRT